jgi:NTP pyrophosphatase (non-canonical NTP hydrolase)
MTPLRPYQQIAIDKIKSMGKVTIEIPVKNINPMQNKLNQVKLFHEAFGFEPNESEQTLRTRIGLLVEEWREYYSAKNKVERLDALCDLLFVNLGTYHLLAINVNDTKHTNIPIYDLLNDLKLSVYDNNKQSFTDTILKITSQIYELIKVNKFESIFDEAFDRVCKSNMSKACKSLDEVHATIAQPQYKDIPLTYIEREGVYNVKVRADYKGGDIAADKLVKSVGYTPVYLDDLLLCISLS